MFNEREKLNNKWEAIASLITDTLNCTQNILFNPRNKGMKKQNSKYVKRHKIK